MIVIITPQQCFDAGTATSETLAAPDLGFPSSVQKAFVVTSKVNQRLIKMPFFGLSIRPIKKF